jgi:hypothetical protein
VVAREREKLATARAALDQLRAQRVRIDRL